MFIFTIFICVIIFAVLLRIKTDIRNLVWNMPEVYLQFDKAVMLAFFGGIFLMVTLLDIYTLLVGLEKQ